MENTAIAVSEEYIKRFKIERDEKQKCFCVWFLTQSGKKTERVFFGSMCECKDFVQDNVAAYGKPVTLSDSIEELTDLNLDNIF